jgi:hypothetical protein
VLNASIRQLTICALSGNPSERENTLNRLLMIRLSSVVLCVAGLGLFSLPVIGQTPAEIETLASRTAERVTKTHQQHIFVSGLQECRFDPEVCTMFETSVRAHLEKMIPGARFIKRENVINILEGRGFLALDAYMPDVLRAVATSAGADILVSDTLQWQSDGYELDRERSLNYSGQKLRVPFPIPAENPWCLRIQKVEFP